jgi:hypothetical protein
LPSNPVTKIQPLALLFPIFPAAFQPVIRWMKRWRVSRKPSHCGSIQRSMLDKPFRRRQTLMTFAEWIFAIVSIDPALLDDTIERVNITLPRRVLKRLDALAQAAGSSRSGYVAQLTLVDKKAA